MQELPKLLCEMVVFLQRQNLLLSRSSRDGRTNSAHNEDEIFELLKENFVIERSKKRDWFDFSFEVDNIFYPINIKVSTMQTRDNLNCKLGIYYALTGKLPNFDNEIKWADFFEAIKYNLAENSKDYYFLVVNKNNPSDTFATSLKQLKDIKPEGNNLPFQAKWNDNRELIQRDFNEAKDFILGVMGQSLALRAKTYSEFLERFPEFKADL